MQSAAMHHGVSEGKQNQSNRGVKAGILHSTEVVEGSGGAASGEPVS